MLRRPSLGQRPCNNELYMVSLVAQCLTYVVGRHVCLVDYEWNVSDFARSLESVAGQNQVWKMGTCLQDLKPTVVVRGGG